MKTFYIILFFLILLITSITIYKNKPIKIKQILLIQLIVLFIIGVVGKAIYENEKSTNEKQFEEIVNSAEDVKMELSNHIDKYNDENIGEVIYYMLQNYQEDDRINANNKQYTSTYVGIYDKDLNCLVQANSEGFVVMWQNVENNMWNITNLEEYLNLKQMNQLKEYYDGSNTIAVNNIFGCYDHDQFIPSYISLYNKTKNCSYTIGTIPEDFVQPAVYFHSFIRNSKTEYKEELDRLVKQCITSYNKDFNAMAISSGNGINASVQPFGDYVLVYGYCFDVSKATLTSDIFMNLIKQISYNLEILTMIIYCFYIKYIHKKQQLEDIRNTFINAMAHEMKTPASVIMNSTEMIQENINPDKHDHYLDMIQKEANHLNELLVSMLEYTRTNKGYKIQKTKVNLYKLVIDSLSHYQEYDSITVKVDIDENIEIEMDEPLMHMVIDNFISNAYDYAKSNIIIEYKNKVFSITNDGELISKDAIDHIWEPLYKEDTSRNNRSKTGMGLSIASNILQLHHFKYGVKQNSHQVSFYFETK